MTESDAAARGTAAGFDNLFETVADYVLGGSVSETGLDAARDCLMDALGCAALALGVPEAAKHLGPWTPAGEVPDGARVPGTPYELDPLKAAFDLGLLIRWLDYNDTWLAAEWAHPSDNFGGLLTLADAVSRGSVGRRDELLTMREVLTAAIKAYEIQGVLALENSFNRVGLDHVLLVKVATAAVSAKLAGGGREHVLSAFSNAWTDGGSLRTYRHAPNTGERKSWAAGDATSRGVQLALMALRGEPGYASALSAPGWGFQDVLLGGREISLGAELGSMVIENVLFKVAYPAEFHAQTAAESAVRLHERLGSRISEVESVVIETQEPAKRIIDKTGPLHNPADRDHSIQYITAVALLDGNLTALDYEEPRASDPRIHALREIMEVVERRSYTQAYYDPSSRAIPNAVRVRLGDGSTLEEETIYPLGHPRRRPEARPLLESKFTENVAVGYDADTAAWLTETLGDRSVLDDMPVSTFMSKLRINGDGRR